LPSRPGARRPFACTRSPRDDLAATLSLRLFARPRLRESSFVLGRGRFTLLWARRRLSTSATLTTREHTGRAFDHRPRRRPRSQSRCRSSTRTRAARRATPSRPKSQWRGSRARERRTHPKVSAPPRGCSRAPGSPGRCGGRAGDPYHRTRLGRDSLPPAPREGRRLPTSRGAFHRLGTPTHEDCSSASTRLPLTPRFTFVKEHCSKESRLLLHPGGASLW